MKDPAWHNEDLSCVATKTQQNQPNKWISEYFFKMKEMFLKLLLVGCVQMVPQKALLLGMQISLLIQGIHSMNIYWGTLINSSRTI